MNKRTSFWRRRATYVVGLSIILAPFAVPALVWSLTLIDPAPAQDDCSFDSVSNAEYRSLLAQAKNQNWTVWPDLSNGLFSPSDRHAIQMKLRGKIIQLSGGTSSPDFQLAASHAVMRSLNAELSSVSVIPNLPRESALPNTEVTFLYFMPKLRFAPLCLSCLFYWDTTLEVFFHHDIAADEYLLRDIVVYHTAIDYLPTKETRMSHLCPYFPREPR